MAKLRKATRKKVKLRIGITGVSNSGKTYTSLLIAFGITGDWSKIALIDSENGRADLYAHLGPYQVLPLEDDYSPEAYIAAITECEQAEGIEVIIIDSISHEWEGKNGILYQAEQLGGGFTSAWKVLTPKHEAFKQKILTSSCHVITTTRRKQEYILQDHVNANGNVTKMPVKVGMKEITRDGWEYELTVNFEMNAQHYTNISKDNTCLFTNANSFIPGVETGRLLAQWCEEGIDVKSEIASAIDRTNKCSTVEELKKEKEQLPVYVKESKAYKAAAIKRYEEIMSGHTQVESAKDQLSADPRVLTDEKLQQFLSRLKTLDAAFYRHIYQSYDLTEEQKREIDLVHNTAVQMDDLVKSKFSNPKDVQRIIDDCFTLQQLEVLYSWNQLIIDRDASIKNIFQTKMNILKQTKDATATN